MRFPIRALRCVALLGVALLGVALLAVAAASAGAPAQEKPREMSAAAAARLFREACATCHVVPDPAFATDRAFLGQIRETA